MRESSAVGVPMQPILLCAYRVDSSPVLDASDRSQLEAHGIGELELRCPEWAREMSEGRVPASQALADRLIAVGYAGMLAPAFYRGAPRDERNLVLWKWSSELPSRILVVDDEGRLTPE